jgi:predicted transcriptional regulator
VKTLAVKLEDSTHAQLTAIAQLEQLPVTGLIKTAIEEFIETKRNQPELTGRAEAMLEEIEQEAAARRAALATLFGSNEEPAPEATGEEASPETDSEAEAPTPLRRSRGKGGEPATS